MLVRTSEFYTPELLRANPEFIFVFGDNLRREGKGGQAAIRNEPNALGLATKRYPSKMESAYFAHYSAEDEIDLRNEIKKVLNAACYKMVVIPFTDKVQLGTGLSELPTRAPNLYKLLTDTFTADMPVASLRTFGIEIPDNGPNLSALLD